MVSSGCVARGRGRARRSTRGGLVSSARRGVRGRRAAGRRPHCRMRSSWRPFALTWPAHLRRTAGPVARAGTEGPRRLNRKTAPVGGHPLRVGFRPLPHTTRTRATSLLVGEEFVGLFATARNRPIPNSCRPQDVVVAGASSDPQLRRVLAVVKARRSAPPPLRGALGLDDGSAHACPDWLLSDDAQL